MLGGDKLKLCLETSSVSIRRLPMTSDSKRRWFAYSLRTMFVVIAIPAVLLGWIAHDFHRAMYRSAERERILALGGRVGIAGTTPFRQRLFGDGVTDIIVLPSSIADSEIDRIGMIFPEAQIWKVPEAELADGTYLLKREYRQYIVKMPDVQRLKPTRSSWRVMD